MCAEGVFVGEMTDEVRFKILVVDDDPLSIKFIQSMLKEADAEIVTADSGAAAIELAREEEYSLILMDVFMQDMTGYEVATRIREEAKTKAPPIIFVTGAFPNADLVRQVYDHGAVDFLLKPLHPVVVQSKVKAFLEIHRQKRALAEMALLKKRLEVQAQAKEQSEVRLALFDKLGRASDPAALLREVLDLILTYVDVDTAGIRIKKEDDYPYLEAKGFPRAFVETEGSLCKKNTEGWLVRDDDGRPQLECVCRLVLSGRTNPSRPFFTQGGSFWTSSTTDLPANANSTDQQTTTRNRCNILRHESVALIPIKGPEGPIGLLQLNDHRKGRLTLECVLFLEDLAGSLGETIARLQVEEALRKSESRYRLLAEHGSDGITLVENDRLVYLSPSCERITGFSSNERLGAHHLNLVHPDDRERVVREIAEGIKRKLTHLKLVYRIVHKKGHVLWLEDHVVREPSTDDRNRLIATSRDITERILTQEELIRHREHLEELVEQRTKHLEQAKKAAEAASRAKTSFLANMTHEIKTPLNAIIGLTEILQRNHGFTEQEREQLTTIHRSGHHLLEIINDVLEMSRLDSGRVELAHRPLDLHGLVSDLGHIFRMRAQGKGLELRVEMSGAVPQAILGDETKIRQIFVNILGNALKFTERGGIAWRLDTESRADLQTWLVAYIEDSGPGISEEDSGRLFQRFEQTAIGLNAGGTGLGLAISQQFAQLMGGKISVTSTMGVGTCFCLKVPIETTVPGDVFQQPVQKSVVGIKEGFGPYRILIAEPRDEIRQLLKEILNQVGFSTRHVANSQSALLAFQKWKPHAIFMGPLLQGTNGSSTTRLIKSLDGGDKTAIFLISDSPGKKDRLSLTDSMADGIVESACHPSEVLEILRKPLELEYVYEVRAPSVHGDAISTSSITELSRLIGDDWQEELERATVSARFESILELIDRLESHAPQVAADLRIWARSFEYQRILDWLKEGKSK